MMDDGGFVSWASYEKLALRTFNCPCCMGVRLMPDGEELEQRLYDFIGNQQQEIRNALELINKQKQNGTNGNKTEQNTTKGGDDE